MHRRLLVRLLLQPSLQSMSLYLCSSAQTPYLVAHLVWVDAVAVVGATKVMVFFLLLVRGHHHSQSAYIRTGAAHGNKRAFSSSFWLWSRAELLLLGRRPFRTWCQKLANAVTMAEGDLRIQLACVGASGLHPLAPFTFTSLAEWPTWIATRRSRYGSVLCKQVPHGTHHAPHPTATLGVSRAGVSSPSSIPNVPAKRM